MADAYDFQVNNLKFRSAITKESPYQRGTAPFRKEQFDSAPTVGDQSLTGWWTRGQLSFHKGAGLKFYEVLDGEAVLNRYWGSDAVDPFTPGEVSLIPDLASLGVAATSATPGTLSGTAGVFYTTVGGLKFYDGTNTTAITTTDGGVPTDVTSDGRYYLTVNGTFIEKQAHSGAHRTNFLANPSLETNTTGWAADTGPNVSFATSVEQFKYGAQSLKVTQSTSSTGWVYQNATGLTIGATYVASVWVYLPTASGAAGATLSAGGQEVKIRTRDEWVRASVTFTADATTEGVSVLLYYPNESNSPSPGQYLYVDGAMLTEFPFDSDYFDGDTLGSWTGAAHGSTSTYASNTPTASYALWEMTSAGHQFENIWWAKGRIWAVDNTGRWYTLAPSGGTVTTEAAIWASGKTDATWSLADSPSAVFIGEAGTIYSLTVDVDGGIIGGYTAPVVAATLPAGELISSLYHYLGYLVICTNKGVRVAVLQDNNLIYGPLTITGDFSGCKRVGASGNLAFVVGEPADHDASTVCALDFTQEVDALRPAWAPWAQLNDVASTSSGALADPSGRLFVWAGNLYGSGLGSGANKALAGELTTGYHRFGTLDPKSFRTLSVRCGGDGGSIGVAWIAADGTVTNLGTITPAEAQKDFAIDLASAERIALRFTLNRDGANVTLSPELLGYQLKAMPVPERQRLLRWPLLITDQKRLRRGERVGREGQAYTDIKALEALESSNAVVTYTDHRTGETGTAYIDSVEMVSTAPATSTDNGFGGLAMLSLRVLD